MMSKHTPAPWEVDNYEHGYGTYKLENFARRSLKSQDIDAYIAEDKANRRLIEAAPLLLEACQFLLSFVPPWANDVPEGLGEMFYGTLSAEGDREVKARVDAVRAAIAKARGDA